MGILYIRSYFHPKQGQKQSFLVHIEQKEPHSAQNCYILYKKHNLGVL